MLLTLLDNDDVKKARRSLIVSSAFLIFLHHVNISSGDLNVFGLRLNFDDKLSLVFAKAASFYFFVMYILRVAEYISDDSLKNLKDILDRSLELKNYSGLNMEERKNREDFEKYVKSWFKEKSSRLFYFKNIVWILSEVMIPAVIFGFSINYSPSSMSVLFDALK